VNSSDRSLHEIDRLWPRLTPARAGVAIAFLALMYSLATMGGHGITYDESALYHAGDRTLYWLQHLGEPDALRLDRPAPPSFHSDFERFPDPQDPFHYPVFPGFVGALTNWIFNTRLRILNTIDGHHLGVILIHVTALWLYCVYASRLLGRGAGVAATIALALFPSAVGHSFNNPKDWPCAEFYGLFVLALGVGVIEARFRELLMAGVFLGLAFSAKMNAVFALATMIAWTPIAYVLLYFRRPLPVGPVAGYLLIPYVAGSLFFALWPWLYQGRVNEWWQHLNEYVTFMVNYGAGSRPTWTTYSWACLLFMSPPLVLATAGIYAAMGWSGDRRAQVAYALLVLWLLVPIGRIAMPRSNFYDGNRHFIEYVPALCTMAGAGAAWIGSQLLARARTARVVQMARRPCAEYVVAAVAAVAISFLVWPVIEYRPYEAAYFNDLIGGLGGAQRRALFAMAPPADRRVNGTEGDYWLSSMREGLVLASKYVPSGEPIGMCPGGDLIPALPHANWPGKRKPLVTAVSNDVRVVYVAPRESLCGFARIRELEAERPILHRIERGGGLIYEILGAGDGAAHPIVTGESLYTKPEWYRQYTR
jgi:hypothetical protein